MDIHELSALELKASLDRGELSSVEVIRALAARNEAVDARVSGFVHRFFERALKEAAIADAARARGESLGPLHGLPLTLKENLDTEGVPSTLGFQSRLDQPAREDATVVRLARSAGAIILGKTNVPQTLLSPMETTNRIWGTTRNPWSASHAPGGSSGGEAAAIATGQSAFGIGTDVGGSIRIPAHFCGIAGLKPTWGRWSNRGSCSVIPGQETIRAQTGPLARTVSDLAFLLRAIPTPAHSQLDPNVPPVPLSNPDDVDVSSLRIGYYEDDGILSPASSVRRAVRRAVKALERTDATVEPYLPRRAMETVLLMFSVLSSDGGASVEALLDGESVIEPLRMTRRIARLDGRVRKALSRGARAMGEERLSAVLNRLGRKSIEEYWALTAKRAAFRSSELESWDEQKLDAVVCPVHVTPAVPRGESKDFTLSFCYVARYNVLDFPAGVVPVCRVRADETKREESGDLFERRAASVEARSEGLPVGVQVIARPYREDIALAVMKAIENDVRQEKDFPWTPIEPK